MNGGLRKLLRPELRDLAAYAAGSAQRDLVRLHANEAPYDFGSAELNRYPEPRPARLVERLASLYEVTGANLVVTRGSDDAIDLLVRCFCRAGRDAIAVCTPTFGMYAMAARLQNASVVEVPLNAEDDFSLDVQQLIDACEHQVRLVFICSPNNPTGRLVPVESVVELCSAVANRAIVVVDEAYIEFANAASVAPLVTGIPNLAVLRTLSKAFALAGARCGALIGSSELVDIVRPAMPPYPLPTPTIDAALEALTDANLRRLHVNLDLLRIQRERLRAAIDTLPVVRRSWPSEANFILAEVDGRERVLGACRRGGILIRDMGAATPVSRHVRITVGTPAQNQRLCEILESLS